MGLRLLNYFFFILCFTLPLYGNLPKSLQEKSLSSVIQNRTLFLLQQGNMEGAINLYLEQCKVQGCHDFDLLQHMGLILLDQGFHSSEAESQLMAIFGAGISGNERALYLLEDGIGHSNPQIQLAAMNFLSNYQNDYADDALNHCLKSNLLLIRLEAAFQLCKKKHSKAVGQTESLMAKVDPALHPLFPQLFALIGSDHAIRILKRLMANQKEEVRIAAIQSAAKHRRDDLLPQIRILASHNRISQQEVCAVALGELGDDRSIEQLNRLSASSVPSVKLAAYQALYRLGRKEAAEPIREAAKEHFLPAIYALGEIKEGERLLEKLIESSDIHVRINAAMALLELRNPKSLPPLTEILVKDHRDLALLPATTLGKGLQLWKILPSADAHFEKNPVLKEIALHQLESILNKAIDLPEEDFLRLCHLLLLKQENALAPTVISLMEKIHSPKAISLLKVHQQQTGAPLIRNYCTLALYRLGEEGPYEELLTQWIYREYANDLIQFRPLVTWESREGDLQMNYQLTPQETSRFLVEAFETFAQKQNDHGIGILLNAIKGGNKNNRYALAGLLIRAAQ